MTFVWLASYPKSGNTWIRFLLNAYRRDPGDPLDLNRPLIGTSKHLERHGFDEAMGISSSELTSSELESYRLQYHTHFIEKFKGTIFAKSHEAFLSRFGAETIFPINKRCKTVYLVRNPLDVAVSYAHHEGCDIDHIIKRMADPEAEIRHGEASFDEFTASWSGHVLSWADQRAMPIHLVRYEDLLEDTISVFSEVVSFCDLELGGEKLNDAIEEARFDRLQQLERKTGFREKPVLAQSFFRSGKKNDWEHILTTQQVDQICADHELMMQRFGYL